MFAVSADEAPLIIVLGVAPMSNRENEPLPLVPAVTLIVVGELVVVAG
jgi:hypothetical protein